MIVRSLALGVLIAGVACAPAPDADAPDPATATSPATTPATAPATDADAPDPATATAPAPTAVPDPIAATPPPAPTAEAVAAGPPAPPVPASFRCTGHGPDWSLDLSAAGMALRLDGTETLLAGELRQTSTGAWTWLGEPGDAPDRTVALLLVPGACFRPEGGNAWPYIAELSLAEGERAAGCCLPATGD